MAFADRVANVDLRVHFLALVEKFPVPDKEADSHQPPQPTEANHDESAGCSASTGCSASSASGQVKLVYDIGAVDMTHAVMMPRGSKRVAVDRKVGTSKPTKRLKTTTTSAEDGSAGEDEV
jgi:hypothetical protein